MKLTIDRSKWRFGGVFWSADHIKKIGITRLLNDQGNMCCLGFLSLACGYKEEDISGYIDPEAIVRHQEAGNKFPQWAIKTKELWRENGWQSDYRAFNSELISKMIRTNDMPKSHLPHEEREVKLTDLFSEAGVEVTFTGEYPDVA